jgi:sec-independent protein translocase protein TatC
MRLLPRRLGHGEEATLVEHLGELRARITVCLIVVVAAFCVTYAFRADIIHWLVQPLPHNRRKLVTFSPAEPFITSFMISFYASFMISLPVIIWQIWGFFAPAFQKHTQRILVGFTLFATALLGAGMTFGYFVALAAAIHFLTNYDSSIYTINIRARDYLGFASLVLIAVGVVFEIPIVILGLVRLGVLTTAKLRKNRRLGIVIMCAIAVALPGVDPVTTTFEMIPLVLLYEASIWLSIFFDKRWKAERVAREAAREAAFEGLER